MAQEQAPEELVGEITHFYSHLNVGIVRLRTPLRIGEKVHIKGHTTDFVQTVDSMQIEHERVTAAKPGDSVGMKVHQHVREGDEVLRVAA